MEKNVAGFLPRDAMHKRGLCRYAVSLCVRLSVTFVYCVSTSYTCSVFPPLVATPFWFLVIAINIAITKRYGNIPTGTPLTGTSNAGGVGKIATFDHYLVLASMTDGPSGVVNISTVELGYRPST